MTERSIEEELEEQDHWTEYMIWDEVAEVTPEIVADLERETMRKDSEHRMMSDADGREEARQNAAWDRPDKSEI